MKKPLFILYGVVFGLVALACSGPDDNFTRKNQPGTDPTTDPNVPQCTDVGTGYTGFAGTKLEEKRLNAKIGADRARMKPYSALRSEYQRTLGVTPDSLDSAEASFGKAPDRFAQEPRASAIQLFTAYRVAFDGCLSYVEKVPAYATAPNAASATAECKTMARKFWSRAPTDDELKACTDVAVTDSAPEPDPKRRWAYTCATLLSSSAFLTY